MWEPQRDPHATDTDDLRAWVEEETEEAPGPSRAPDADRERYPPEGDLYPEHDPMDEDELADDVDGFDDVFEEDGWDEDEEELGLWQDPLEQQAYDPRHSGMSTGEVHLAAAGAWPPPERGGLGRGFNRYVLNRPPPSGEPPTAASLRELLPPPATLTSGRYELLPEELVLAGLSPRLNHVGAPYGYGAAPSSARSAAAAARSVGEGERDEGDGEGEEQGEGAAPWPPRAPQPTADQYFAGQYEPGMDGGADDARAAAAAAAAQSLSALTRRRLRVLSSQEARSDRRAEHARRMVLIEQAAEEAARLQAESGADPSVALEAATAAAAAHASASAAAEDAAGARIWRYLRLQQKTGRLAMKRLYSGTGQLDAVSAVSAVRAAAVAVARAQAAQAFSATAAAAGINVPSVWDLGLSEAEAAKLLGMPGGGRARVARLVRRRPREALRFGKQSDCEECTFRPRVSAMAEGMEVRHRFLEPPPTGKTKAAQDAEKAKAAEAARAAALQKEPSEAFRENVERQTAKWLKTRKQQTWVEAQKEKAEQRAALEERRKLDVEQKKSQIPLPFSAKFEMNMKASIAERAKRPVVPPLDPKRYTFKPEVKDHPKIERDRRPVYVRLDEDSRAYAERANKLRTGPPPKLYSFAPVVNSPSDPTVSPLLPISILIFMLICLPTHSHNPPCYSLPLPPRPLLPVAEGPHRGVLSHRRHVAFCRLRAQIRAQPRTPTPALLRRRRLFLRALPRRQAAAARGWRQRARRVLAAAARGVLPGDAAATAARSRGGSRRGPLALAHSAAPAAALPAAAPAAAAPGVPAAAAAAAADTAPQCVP